MAIAQPQRPHCPTTHLTPRRGLHTLRTYLRHDGNLVSCSASANGFQVQLRVTGSVTGRVLRAHAFGSGGLPDRFRFLYINRFLGSQFFKPASSKHSSHSPSPLVPCPWCLGLCLCYSVYRVTVSASTMRCALGTWPVTAHTKTRGLPVVCCLCAVFDGGAGFTLTAILNHRSAGSGLLCLLLLLRRRQP